jgi:hypothetical protein
MPDVFNGCMAASVLAETPKAAKPLERSRPQVAIEPFTLRHGGQHFKSDD